MDLDADLVDVEKLHQQASDVKCFCCATVDGIKFSLRTRECNCCLRSSSIANCCSMQCDKKSCCGSLCLGTSCTIAVHVSVEVRNCFCWKLLLVVLCSFFSVLETVLVRVIR